MTSKRRNKHKPEQIVVKLRDADAMQNASIGGPGQAAKQPLHDRHDFAPLRPRYRIRGIVLPLLRSITIRWRLTPQGVLQPSQPAASAGNRGCSSYASPVESLDWRLRLPCHLAWQKALPAKMPWKRYGGVIQLR